MSLNTTVLNIGDQWPNKFNLIKYYLCWILNQGVKVIDTKFTSYRHTSTTFDASCRVCIF